MTADLPATRNQIRKASKLARDWWHDPRPDVSVTEEIGDAFALLLEYRAGFQKPLDKVTIQMRRFVRYETDEVVVAQRLKRMPTIMGKLGRQPAMDITRMQDIGGCRAVLPTLAEVDGVLTRISSHWPIEKVYDYVGNPKPSGYRAVHAVVRRDGRLIEIQLRTRVQQRWAAAVERTGARLRVSVKDGEGPPEVLRFFWLLGEVAGLEETGRDVDDALMAEIDEVAAKVRARLERNG